MEKKCQWYFGPQARGNEKGPNNPTALTFKGTKYHSLIRESIQNSLDAVDDSSKPVEVRFEYRSFSGMDFPEFFKLKEHICGCLNKYPTDENAQKLFRPMLSYFNDFRLDQNIGYLRIIDSNTTGMHYDVNDPRSPFNAFISEGIASKPNGAGGSFGFGKAVFWMLSPISTVFVSSKTDTQVNFEGQAKLCTHYLTLGEDLSPNGLYDTNGKGEVITDERAIPDEFKPRKKGTSVFVLGMPSIDDDMRNELVMAVLRNFWMAIYRERLVVVIDGVEVSKATLSSLMEKHFPLDNNKEKEIYDYNPRYFYDIILKSENEIEGYKKLTDIVFMNGKECPVTLYMYKHQDASGQYVFMRSPLMTVFSERSSAWKGTDGIFICESEYGNSHLREMEDCSHDSWSRKNYEARGNTPSVEAARSLNAIKQFIKEIVRQELQQENSETVQVVGLDKILTIYTPQDISTDSKKDDIVDLETILGKEKQTKSIPKLPRNPNIHKSDKKKAVYDPNGRMRSNNGGKKRKRPIVPGPVKPGSLRNRSTESNEGKEGIYAVPVDVSYRTWSQIDDSGKVWHIIRIYSNEEIENALIQVFGVDEDGKSLGLNIEEVIGYEARTGEEFTDSTDFEDSNADSRGASKQVKNAIGGVHINQNVPLTLKVRFNSDIKYSLRINSDKIESNESK